MIPTMTVLISPDSLRRITCRAWTDTCFLLPSFYWYVVIPVIAQQSVFLVAVQKHDFDLVGDLHAVNCSGAYIHISVFLCR